MSYGGAGYSSPASPRLDLRRRPFSPRIKVRPLHHQEFLDWGSGRAGSRYSPGPIWAGGSLSARVVLGSSSGGSSAGCSLAAGQGPSFTRGGV
jgi:hypothetical protein